MDLKTLPGTPIEKMKMLLDVALQKGLFPSMEIAIDLYNAYCQLTSLSQDVRKLSIDNAALQNDILQLAKQVGDLTEIKQLLESRLMEYQK